MSRLTSRILAQLCLLGSSFVGATSSILFTGGTIIGLDPTTESLTVTRNGSLLLTGDRITAVLGPGQSVIDMTTSPIEVVDVQGSIISPGFIDTHRHGWQTAFKTLGSNTTLIEYFFRYGEFASEGLFTADDVYVGQLTGLYEALNAGVTTTLDHAHHTWSPETAQAGLQGSIDSGARVFWAYALRNVTNFTVPEQVAHFRDIAAKGAFKGTPTSLGIAYDFFGPNPVMNEVKTVLGLANEFNISVLTSHCLQGPWGYSNSPEDLLALGIINATFPVVLSHCSFLTAAGATILRASNNTFISITPESESHYGHTHPHSHVIQDRASLGVDTHFTFSTDIITQARLWLQKVRYLLFDEVLAGWRLPTTSPMSVNQAFLLATRRGALALNHPDLGGIFPGAKADLVIWGGESPALLGWVDPVAAVILHASVGDIRHVVVDGKFAKRDGRIVAAEYPALRRRFLDSARRIQGVLRGVPHPVPEGSFSSGYAYDKPNQVAVDPREGGGYGPTFV